MDIVKKVLKENLPDNTVRFIFPSEVSASFWRRKSLDLSDMKAVLSDRFISWDKFKEEYFALNQEGIPVNSIMRNLFAVSLLEENKKKGFFRYIIPPEHKENSGSFGKLIASLLPKLPGLVSDVHERNLSLPPGMVADFMFLQERYFEFLGKGGLFEPGWMTAGISGLDGLHYLFFPEVIMDYGEFRSDLAGIENFREVSQVNTCGRDILKFHSSAAEIKWLLTEIDNLLYQGIDPGDIVITAADTEGWRERLEAAAALRSIPLSFHGGLPLSSYPGASFFKSIRMCFTSGFSSDAVKQLLLNGALPWKEEFPASQLVSFGIEHNCFVNYRLGGRVVDLWEKKLERAEKSGLLEAYRRIRNSVSAVNRAETFTKLKGEVQKFISVFLDTGKWEGTETLREFQFALDSLNSAADAAGKCPDLSIPSPFDFWLSVMDEKIYVPRRKRGGISVYPYRVAGGIGVKWHFLPGFSQRVSAVIKDDYPFIRDDQKKSVSSSKIDFTEDFISLFCSSGENVVFSMSSDSFGGPEIPPTDFVARNAVKNHIPGSSGSVDLFDMEAGFWKGISGPPDRIPEVMARGLENALDTVLAGKEIDYTVKRTGSGSLKKAFEDKIFREPGIFEVSPTMLDSFYSCPYAFFLNYVLDIGSPGFSMSFKDHMLIGNIIHRSFKDLFSFINKATGSFDPAEIDSYREEAFRITDRIFSYYERIGRDMFPPVWEETRTFVKEHLDAFLSAEAEKFPRFRMESAEKDFSVFLEEYGISLRGKVDRISVSDSTGRRCLVDYKKNFRLSLESLNPPEGLPSSFQLFFYMFLAEAAGLDVHHVSYYNFTKDRYIDLFSEEGGKKVLSRDDVDARIDEMILSIRKMKDRIVSGDFTVESCGSCDLRNICRKKFTVR